MGRILDLFSEVAAAAEEGPDGLVLDVADRERLQAEWEEQDVDDAIDIVHDSLLQGELVEAADSLSARLVELLGALGGADAFGQLRAGDARLSLEAAAQLARRVDRLEEVLEVYREQAAPDRRGFDALRRRLADHGIEPEMEAGHAEDSGEGGD